MNKVKKFFYSQKAAPYVFVLPFVLTVLLFWIFPIGNGVLLSFQDVLKDKWVGLKNYERLLSDKIFLKAVWNSVSNGFVLKYWINALSGFSVMAVSVQRAVLTGSNPNTFHTSSLAVSESLI